MPLQEIVTISKLELFASRFIITDNGCWHWTAGKSRNGRGGFHHTLANGKHKTHLAYRLLYQVIHGDLKTEQVLDHLCKNPSCVNPGHLEVVTNQDNIKRYYGAMTHCKRGHEFGEQPVWVQRSSYNQRRCLTCHNLRHRKEYKNVSPTG